MTSLAGAAPAVLMWGGGSNRWQRGRGWLEPLCASAEVQSADQSAQSTGKIFHMVFSALIY